MNVCALIRGSGTDNFLSYGMPNCFKVIEFFWPNSLKKAFLYDNGRTKNLISKIFQNRLKWRSKIVFSKNVQKMAKSAWGRGPKAYINKDENLKNSKSQTSRTP